MLNQSVVVLARLCCILFLIWLSGQTLANENEILIDFNEQDPQALEKRNRLISASNPSKGYQSFSEFEHMPRSDEFDEVSSNEELDEIPLNDEFGEVPFKKSLSPSHSDQSCVDLRSFIQALDEPSDTFESRPCCTNTLTAVLFGALIAYAIVIGLLTTRH